MQTFNFYKFGSGRFLEDYNEDGKLSDLDNEDLQLYNSDLELEKDILMNPTGKTPARIDDEN